MRLLVTRGRAREDRAMRKGSEGLARKGEQPLVIKYKQEESVRLLLLHDPCFLYIYIPLFHIFTYLSIYMI